MKVFVELFWVLLLFLTCFVVVVHACLPKNLVEYQPFAGEPSTRVIGSTCTSNKCSECEWGCCVNNQCAAPNFCFGTDSTKWSQVTLNDGILLTKCIDDSMKRYTGGSSAQTGPVVTTTTPTPSPVVPGVPVGPVAPGQTARLQITVIPNWWDGSDSPVQIAKRLSFAPNIGTFFDVYDSWDASTFDQQIQMVLSMRNASQLVSGPLVFDVAILPQAGLDKMTNDMFERMARSFKQAHDRGVKVRTRFLTEANGTWFKYSGLPGGPQELIALMRRFFTVVKGISKDTEIMFNMNWSYRTDACGPSDPVDATNYFPGQDYIDSIGLDIYYHGPKCVNELPKGDEVRQAILACKFYDLVKRVGKPFYIAETNRAFKIGCANASDAMEYEMKTRWLRQLLDPALQREFPLYAGFTLFELRKQEDGELRDFRMTFNAKLVSELKSGLGIGVGGPYTSSPVPPGLTRTVKPVVATTTLKTTPFKTTTTPKATIRTTARTTTLPLAQGGGIGYKTAYATGYNSYPDPGSNECINYSGCQYLGQFAYYEGTMTREQVQSTNIVSMFVSSYGDAGPYKRKKLELRDPDTGRTLVVQVLDTCGDHDCPGQNVGLNGQRFPGCCSANASFGDGTLIDLERSTAERFYNRKFNANMDGFQNKRIQWRCIDC